MATIEVQGLTKRYGDMVAVDNISFEVNEGEILGLLGPNGAGKTTTMRVLTCFMPATSGTVRVAGYDVFTQSLEVRKRIGYMPENVPLYLEMRVREYLLFRAKIKRVPLARREATIESAMGKCGVTRVAQQVIGTLSRGYRQRVGLADALLGEPPILIFDEPLISLDPNQQQEAKHVITGLRGDHTVIFSSHILHDVEEVCDRLIIINEGRIVGKGTPAELTEQFTHGASVVAEVRGPADEVKAAMEAVPGVKEVVVDRDGDAASFHVVVDTEQDPREAIAKMVVAKGWGLLDIRAAAMGLADIFARLTLGLQEK